jgi:hypothetical protein
MNPQLNSVDETAVASVPPDATDVDRRDTSDRRQTPTSVWAAFPPAGRRMRMRRANEHREPYFTDRFSPTMLVCVLTLVFASLADAGLTIYVLYGGGAEVNPLMKYLLGHGIGSFVVGKYVLTVIGLPILLIFQNHYLFNTRVRVRHLIPAAVALYAVLIGYQLMLIDHRIGW